VVSSCCSPLRTMRAGSAASPTVTHLQVIHPVLTFAPLALFLLDGGRYSETRARVSSTDPVDVLQNAEQQSDARTRREMSCPRTSRTSVIPTSLIRIEMPSNREALHLIRNTCRGLLQSHCSSYNVEQERNEEDLSHSINGCAIGAVDERRIARNTTTARVLHWKLRDTSYE